MRSREPTSDSGGRLRAEIGLCRRCVHLDLLDSGRSLFVFCGLSRTDPRYPRYPPLPVLACEGFEPTAAE